MNDAEVYDVIIVGAGPAGLAAGLYAARDRYKTLLLEKNGLPGGQIMLTDRIENYPGTGKISGADLIEAMKKQVLEFAAQLRTNRAADGLTRRADGLIEVSVNKGAETHLARAVILAPGSDYRQLGVPGEAQMRQATRVSYCATCDGAFYRDKEVLAIGGGNTAVQDVIYLASRFTKKITLIHRRTEFRAQKVLVEELRRAAERHNIEIKLPYVLEEIAAGADGSEIDHVRIRNVQTGRQETLSVYGVFIFAGMVPNTAWLRRALRVDGAGCVLADPVTMKTSMPGVFVAGDCRKSAALQLATACADGVVAAMMLKEYYRDSGSWPTAALEQTGEH